MRHLLALILALFSLPATAQQVGTLIAADPVADPPIAIQAWRIRYWTSGGDGTVREATGMVVAPSEVAPTASRRVIAWTHGAWGRGRTLRTLAERQILRSLGGRRAIGPARLCRCRA